MAELHYRATTDYAATSAVIALMQLARTSAAEFSFGPLDWPTIQQQGLTISGEIDAAKGLLDAVRGLVEVEQ